MPTAEEIRKLYISYGHHTGEVMVGNVPDWIRPMNRYTRRIYFVIPLEDDTFAVRRRLASKPKKIHDDQDQAFEHAKRLAGPGGEVSVMDKTGRVISTTYV